MKYFQKIMKYYVICLPSNLEFLEIKKAFPYIQTKQLYLHPAIAWFLSGLALQG